MQADSALDGPKVFAVSINASHQFSKAPRPSITLVKDRGIEGDAHFGEFVKHRYLARRNSRAPNLRQIYLLSGELLETLCADGYDVAPGELGENITATGLDLEGLPLDAELRLGETARVRLTGLRTPCVLIDRFRAGLKSRLVASGRRPRFRAGVMAVVAKSGDISPGDAIDVMLPEGPLQPLPAL